jgi:hypothetical protein
MTFHSVVSAVCSLPAWFLNVGKTLVNWCLNHPAIARAVFFPTLCFSLIRFACRCFSYVFSHLLSYRDSVVSIVDAAASGASAGGFGSVFSVVNSILPVVEALQLLFALGAVHVAVLTVKSVMWIYNKIPFKAS